MNLIPTPPNSPVDISPLAMNQTMSEIRSDPERYRHFLTNREDMKREAKRRIFNLVAEVPAYQAFFRAKRDEDLTLRFSQPGCMAFGVSLVEVAVHSDFYRLRERWPEDDDDIEEAYRIFGLTQSEVREESLVALYELTADDVAKSPELARLCSDGITKRVKKAIDMMYNLE